jgi:isoleucyl-tRNA synthetase
MVSELQNPQRFAKEDFAEGSVFLDLKLSKSELAEGLARDAVRRMQQMRKEMDLKVDSFVHAYVVAPSDKSASLLKSKRDYIAGEATQDHDRGNEGEVALLHETMADR